MKQAVVNEPLLPVENGNDTESIWASILCDAESSTKTAPTTKSLVVLGDHESGRTTLVAKLQGNDDPKRGADLEYHYIDIKDDDHREMYNYEYLVCFSNLWERIADGIVNSSVGLCLLSQKYYESKSCQQEFFYVFNKLKKNVIPIYIGRSNPPNHM
ncbi:unnamed protein product, partial [Rotaria magnacalcarata]